MSCHKLRFASVGLAWLLVAGLGLQGCVATAIAGATLGVAGATVKTAAAVGGAAVGTTVKVAGGAVHLATSAGKHLDKTGSSN